MILFDDRHEAAEILAKDLLELKRDIHNPLVFAVPRGGIPIGYSIAGAFDASLDVVPIRKLPIPDKPEAGFGAVTLNKVAIFNQLILSRLNLSESQISGIVDEVYEEVLRRNKLYRNDRPLPDFKAHSVILTDDGLASGYTMLAAVKMIRESGAREVIVAVPVAHQIAYDLVAKEADDVVAFHISRMPLFAVASFYKKFPDLSDDESIACLEKRREEMKTTPGRSQENASSQFRGQKKNNWQEGKDVRVR